VVWRWLWGHGSAGELAGERLLGVLSSDYVPASALHGAFLLHVRHGWALADAIASVTSTPAERVGLDDRGEIAPGRLAGLVRVRLAGDPPIVTAGVGEGRPAASGGRGPLPRRREEPADRSVE